ncbi:MAG: 50S ribosomal protein L29 [bacterium]|nr:50S ribosomal protein L29 [bacterium]
MKTKETEQLKNKAEAELVNEIKKSKDKLWELQVDLRAGKLKNVSDIAKTKKMIARINTVLSEKKNNKAK